MKMGKKNSILKNILHLFYSTALASVLNATALIILAAYLQSYNYGVFSVALAFAMIMGFFTDAGLREIVLREGSKKEVDTAVLISSYIKMRFVLLFSTLILGFIIIHISNSDNKDIMQTSYLLIIPMVSGIALQSIGTTYFQLIEKMQYSGLIRIVSSVCLVTSISIGVNLDFNPFIICTLYGFSYLIAGVFGISLVSKNVKINLKTPFHKGLLQNLGSFTLGGILFVMLPHIGPIVLEKTITLGDVGFFAVAYRIPQALQQIPFIVAGAYYPVLFRAFNNNFLQEHLKLNITLVKLMAIVGMIMTVPFFYMSDFVIRTLFGEQWIDASTPLKILSIMLTIQAVNISLADGLTTRAMQSHRTIVQAISVITGIAMYALLSKSHGITGAALAGVLIEVIALVGFWLCIPNRWVIARQSILPYLFFFMISLGSIQFLFNTVPVLAVVLHLLLIGIVFLKDKQFNKKITELLISTKIFAKWKLKSEKSREVENGS
jgi:O-antigen/teichoic acid export membrane protein